ncbi:MAG TPA: L,D-transpeptidase family protein [Acidimicrobiia bacterium]|nr:L,D-transpeptidase family protein [Acidimicrobiia bacterium]
MTRYLTAFLIFGLTLATPAVAATDIPGEAINHPLPPHLRPGSVGPTVADLQARLLDAGFFPGRTDGVYGEQTVGAVLAFQKLYDLERTGIFRQEDWDLLGREITGPGPGPEPDRIEVDLRRQVLYLIEAESVAGVFPISSANGESYRNARGKLIRAVTPEGRFEFRRSRQGWWESYLGFLYSPFYFYGGYALHGSNSVPAFPASHGCVRVEIEDMDFLKSRIQLGMPIYLYGDTVSRDELITP